MTAIPKLALLLPLLAASPALAQGTEAQRAACGPDAFRLCASSIPDPDRTAARLRRERERLSGGCRAMFDDADAKTRTAAAPKPAMEPKPAAASVRTARADRERRGAESRLPRQEAAATPRERSARAETGRPARVARLDRPARATPRTVAGGDDFGGFSALEAQAHGWHRTLAGYAGSIESRFTRLGSVDAGRLDLGRLPGL